MWVLVAMTEKITRWLAILIIFSQINCFSILFTGMTVLQWDVAYSFKYCGYRSNYDYDYYENKMKIRRMLS